MVLADKYINPFTDFGFKKLFGTEPNKDLLIDFLNQLLPKGRQIQDLTYSNVENPGNTEADRKSIFDIYCTGKEGEEFIVEMQKAKQDYFKDRSVYYSTFPIQKHAHKSNWNYQLKPVYTVGVLDFKFMDDLNDTKVLHYVQLKDQHCQVFYDKLTYIYLTMPNFKKTEVELETTMDKWLFVLKNLSNLQEIPHKLQNRLFQKLFRQAEIAKYTQAERAQYEESLKHYRDLKNVIDSAVESAIVQERKLTEAALKEVQEERKQKEEALLMTEDLRRQIEALQKQINPKG